jgi:hypothetical protein
MSMKAIRPSTLDGIKRLAKSIKTDQKIKHAEALDQASRLAGYFNYRHAMNVLDRLPSPRVEAEWDGQSAPMSTELVKNKPRRLDVKKSARPIGKMPIEAHAEVGRLLQSVLMSAFQHDGIYDRLTSLCGELDGWAEGEYTQAELPNEQFFKLYYNGESSPSYEDPPSKECRERQVADLVRVKEVLTTHYPDCPPLRSVLKKTDAAAKSLQQWGN